MTDEEIKSWLRDISDAEQFNRNVVIPSGDFDTLRALLYAYEKPQAEPSSMELIKQLGALEYRISKLEEVNHGRELHNNLVKLAKAREKTTHKHSDEIVKAREEAHWRKMRDDSRRALNEQTLKDWEKGVDIDNLRSKHE